MPDVRLAVYQWILETGRVPLVAQVADRLSIPVEDVRTECRRLQNIAVIHFAVPPRRFWDNVVFT